jgi:tetrahydromethanopterin S-methyltransferase subunit B
MNDLTTEDKLYLKVFKLEERISDLEAENKKLREALTEAVGSLNCTPERQNEALRNVPKILKGEET